MTAPRLAEVKTLYTANATEIVKMLRHLADQIEKQNLKIKHAVCTIQDEDNRVNHYAWGKTSPHEAATLYGLGHHQALRASHNGEIHPDVRTV